MSPLVDHRALRSWNLFDRSESDILWRRKTAGTTWREVRIGTLELL